MIHQLVVTYEVDADPETCGNCCKLQASKSGHFCSLFLYKGQPKELLMTVREGSFLPRRLRECHEAAAIGHGVSGIIDMAKQMFRLVFGG